MYSIRKVISVDSTLPSLNTNLIHINYNFVLNLMPNFGVHGTRQTDHSSLVFGDHKTRIFGGNLYSNFNNDIKSKRKDSKECPKRQQKANKSKLPQNIHGISIFSSNKSQISRIRNRKIKKVNFLEAFTIFSISEY